MIPPKLKRGDPTGKIFDLWNMLIDHLNGDRLVPGCGIRLTRMPSGVVISAKNAVVSSGGDTAYTGYLCATYVAKEKKLGVICGFDPKAEIAGYCWVNGKIFSVTKNVKIPAKEGVLMLKAELGKNVTLEVLPGIPDKDSVKNTDYHPLAIVKKIVSGEKETFTVFQISRWEFPQLWIFGECGENEDEVEAEE